MTHDPFGATDPPAFRYSGCLKAALPVFGLLVSIVCLNVQRSLGNDAMRFLPPELAVDHRYWSASEGIFMESCGATVFGLTPSTVRNIEARGIDFFNQVHKARDAPRTYSLWSRTPLPRGHASRAPIGLDCARSLHPPIRTKVLEGLRRTGNYYVTAGSEQLLVIPDEELVALFHAD